MRRFQSLIITACCGALITVGSTAQSAPAEKTGAFNDGMQPILASYLEIYEALTADSTDGIRAAARSIADGATKLDAQSVTGEHTAHYKELPAKLRSAAEEMTRADRLAGARKAFMQLSDPMVMWAAMARPAGVEVVFCPMAKSSWLQKRGSVRNPFYGEDMRGCGQVVSAGQLPMGAMKHDMGAMKHDMGAMKHDHSEK